MKKRVYGLETEYGIILIRLDGRWVSERLDVTFNLVDLRNFIGGEFMANGSRIYVDTGNHPEYCTAECLDPYDLVAHDKAGEKLLNRIFNKFSEIHRENGNIHLFKNNVQHGEGSEIDEHSIPITFGCHENFLMEASLGLSQLKPVLVPFLVVRQIIAGAGWVANINELQAQNIPYTISQRYRFISEEASSSTHGGWNRGILCTARWDEPHADKEKYRRLHLILGDSNMSELSTYLKTAAIGILLEMLEENYPFSDRLASFVLKKPVKALQLVSEDLTCKKPVIELDNGNNISAIDLFWVYIKAMEEYERNQGLDKELSNALKVLTDVLQRLEKREIDRETLMEINSQGLDEELDWLLKKSILEDSLRRFGCCWKDFTAKKVTSEERKVAVSVYDQIRAKDKKYHDISEEGLYNIYVAEPDLSPAELRAAQIRTPRLVKKEEIANMEKNPPQNTRAKIRGEFIKFLEERGLKDRFRIQWDCIVPQFHPIDYSAVYLEDPLASSSDELDKIRRSLS